MGDWKKAEHAADSLAIHRQLLECHSSNVKLASLRKGAKPAVKMHPAIRASR